MDTLEDVTSSLKSQQNEIEDLEKRIGEVMMKQLQIKQELNLVKEELEKVKVVEEEKTELKFPNDYQFTEELRKIMDALLETQKAWSDRVQAAKIKTKDLTGIQIFKEMSQHLSKRMEYLQTAKVLIEGPLLPPPPPPPQEEDKPKEEESKVEKKITKHKKGKSKKSKKK